MIEKHRRQLRINCIARVNGDKMHKGVFGENVQNSKIKSQNAQSLHAPVRTMKSRA